MAIPSRRLPWWQRLRWEHLIAASVAIVLNTGGVWHLGRHTVSAFPAEAEEDHFTQLVFIQKEPEPATLRSAVSASLHGPETTTKSTRPRLALLTTLPATELQHVAEPPSSGDPESTQGRSLNLSVPEARISFERNPVAKQETPNVEAPVRMSLTIKDRSFGGMMQRMTSASICLDLRKVLNSSPANAASIIASMENYGCKV